MIFFKMSCFPFQTKASFRTSEIVSTGIIFIDFNFCLSMIISCMFDFGTMMFFSPASIAASTLEVTPPIGRTSPLTDREPVIEVFCFMGMSLKAEITDVATAIDAESPSTPS